MTRVQQTYLELLKTAIWNQDVQILVHPDDLQSIIQLAAFQGTGPLVFDQLLKLKGAEIPDALRMQMKQKCVQSMMLQQSMFGTLMQAWNALVKEDVHPVLLKGFALAQYYPQPHLRQWGDIDLYVGQKQYHTACKALKATFPNADYPPEEDEDRKHFNFILPNTVVELHRISMAFSHPRDRRYYEQLEETYLTKDGPTFEINGLDITLPEETFNLFFVFLHAWHHFTATGMNMKQLCDIAILLHAKRHVIDRARLQEMLRKLYLLEVWQLFMYIIVDYLRLPQEECPFYTDQCKERAELLFKRILRESSARKHEPSEPESPSYLKRKWITFQSRMADSRLVKPYAPRYATHMAWSDILHGLERTINGSEKAVNVECV